MELNELLINSDQNSDNIIRFKLKERGNCYFFKKYIKKIFLWFDIFVLEIFIFLYYCQICKLKIVSKYIDCSLCGELNCYNCYVLFVDHDSHICWIKRIKKEIIFNIIWVPMILKLLYSPIIFSIFIIRILFVFINLFVLFMVIDSFSYIFFSMYGFINQMVNYALEMIKYRYCYFFHIIFISYMLLLITTENGRISISYSAILMFWISLIEFIHKYANSNFHN